MPPLPQGLHGIREITPENCILDSGVLYANIDITALQGSSGTAFADSIATATRLGATRGGSQFTLGKTNRQLEADGARAPIAEFNRTTMTDPKLTVSLLEHTLTNIRAYLGSTTATNHTSYTEIQPVVNIESGDYLDNIAIFATFSGSANPVCIVLDNCLATSSPEFPFVDKNEVTVKVEFIAHTDAANPSTVPVRFFIPIEAGS